MAHARRKFHELRANHASKIGEQALRYFVAVSFTEVACHKLTAVDSTCRGTKASLGESPRIEDTLKVWPREAQA